jgi:hypothetical protein
MLLSLLMQHMKRYLLLLVLLSLTITVYCQQITFQKTYGGTERDEAVSAQQTTDGGYIITGTTRSFGVVQHDLYLIKTNVYGDTLWTETFGGMWYDDGYSICQTIDGGYIIAGYTAGPGVGNGDVFLIKTDANGNLLWAKAIGGLDYDDARSIKQTTDGGYIMTGQVSGSGVSFTDAYLIKTYSNGNVTWTKTFGGSGFDYAASVQQTSDGGYIIAGTFEYNTALDYDAYLIKTDPNGDSLWIKSFGGTDSDEARSVHQTTDGGYVIAGATFSFGAGGYDLYLIKTDSSGNLLWSKTFGGTNDEYGYSVQQTTDGGYVIAGTTSSFGAGNSDIYLIKTDANGDSLWTKTFGGLSDDGTFGALSVQQTNDAGYIIASVTNSFGAGNGDVYLIKTDSLGNSDCNEGSTATLVTIPATIVRSPATTVSTGGSVFIPAPIIGSGGTVTTLCTTVGINEISTANSFLVSPNPFTDVIKLADLKIGENASIVVYDLMGAIVYQQEFSNQTSATLNLSFLQQGVYFLNVKANGESWTKKIVKM